MSYQSATPHRVPSPSSSPPQRPGPHPTTSLSDIGSDLTPGYNPLPSRTVPPDDLTIDRETTQRNRYPPLKDEGSPLNTPETGLSISMHYEAERQDREKGMSSPEGLRLGKLNIADDGPDQEARPYASKRGSKSRFAFDLEPPMEVSTRVAKWMYS